MRYSGRDFTPEDIETIRAILADHPGETRSEISRLVCKALGWRKPNGTPKDLSCRQALQAMDQEGLIRLPPPRQAQSSRRHKRPYAFVTEPGKPVTTPAGDLTDLELQPVAEGDRTQSLLWGDFVDRYHYLGYQPMAGAQLRYFVRAHGQVLALLAFSAAAWKLAPRDKLIGWNDEQRERNLHLVVNNARFLILPWVQSRNLASRILAMAATQAPIEWETRYAYRPVMLETFVEKDRYLGTCYKAANWLHVGDTQGRGKLDTDHTATKPIKGIWLLTLTPSFRELLCR